ncbi:MAG: hypothetical protein MJ236_04200 [Clostridia bacterium]|nr:hypothetical protein [Clostridia bacterium]
MKNKKPLFITLISLDIALTIFLFVVSIIMLATMPSPQEKESLVVKDMITYFQKNPNVYLLVGVLPLFILLVVNIVFLIKFIKKSSEKKKVELNDLSDEEKEALRKELLKDLQK